MINIMSLIRRVECLARLFPRQLDAVIPPQQKNEGVFVRPIFIFTFLLPLMSFADDRASVPSWAFDCGYASAEQCRAMIEQQQGPIQTPEKVVVEPEVTPPPAVVPPVKKPAVTQRKPMRPQQKDQFGVLAEKVVNLTNEYRRRNGLYPLKVDSVCWDAAFDHARDMARHEYFSHYGRDGSSPTVRYQRRNKNGQKFKRVSENIAHGEITTPESAMRMWINSGGHHKQLVSREWTHMGVGVAYSRSGDRFFVQCFSNLR